VPTTFLDITSVWSKKVQRWNDGCPGVLKAVLLERAEHRPIRSADSGRSDIRYAEASPREIPVVRDAL